MARQRGSDADTLYLVVGKSTESDLGVGITESDNGKKSWLADSKGEYMAQNVVINGVTYSNVPSVQIPKTDNTTAEFIDTSDATLDGGSKMLSGVTAYANGTKYTGSITSKTAATYTPTTSDQTISSGQYLSGAQTIKGDANLTASNIANGVTIFGVTGSLSAAVISQDGVTKVLSIS